MSVKQELFNFISDSPTAYHAVDTIKKELVANGYAELCEADEWALADGGKYFVVRNGSSIIAFKYKSGAASFNIAASHSDSPSFRLKMTPETCGAYNRLEVEKYGGMIFYSWLDRPLSLAGRVVVKDGSQLKSVLVNIDRPIAVIPSVAIHLNRGVNDGYKFNPATDMLPLVGTSETRGLTLDAIAREAGVSPESIVSHDLFLYNREKGISFGISDEFILSPRLDDLECVFASVKGFLAASDGESVPVLAVFDNEEVGSETKQGAASTFMQDTLRRIAKDETKYARMLAQSFMVSADNAHAKHPNHPELSDPDNAPMLNGGVVVKWNANQRYATDGVSAAIFDSICGECGVKVQNYYNRADMLGGSTLGSISNTKVAISTVDIGLPQLGMHSASEVAGVNDVADLVKVFEKLFSKDVLKTV